MSTLRTLALLTLLASISACTTVPLEKDVYPDDPTFSPVPAQSLQPPPMTRGSLYQERYAFGLYTDQQATRVGDIITVIFDEQYQSKKSAQTKAKKSSKNDIAATNILGESTLFGVDVGVGTNAKRDFSGKGEADRSNSLSGQVSVTVAEILPNGILRIRGEKWLTLSEGKEYIRIRGLIRPQDISPDNTVPSSKVADARISFGGSGGLDNSTKQGILDRVLNSPWWPL